MSYNKMMKWNKKHRKGISYKKGFLGFNSSGITAEQIKSREKKYLEDLSTKSAEEIEQLRINIKELTSNRKGSWEWEWCVFQRHYGL